MLILLLALSLTLLILFLKFWHRTKPEPYEEVSGLHYIFATLSWIIAFVVPSLFIAICCIAPNVATEDVLDNKIAMYQEENAIIEQDLAVLFDKYKNTNQDISQNVTTTDNLFTKLDVPSEDNIGDNIGDNIAQHKLEHYFKNCEKIKQLKEKKVNIPKTKWILYFGS